MRFSSSGLVLCLTPRVMIRSVSFWKPPLPRKHFVRGSRHPGFELSGLFNPALFNSGLVRKFESVTPTSPNAFGRREYRSDKAEGQLT